PYSYDLKWIVKRLKKLQGLDYEEVTDLIDWDNSNIDSSGVTVHAYRSGHELYIFLHSLIVDATHDTLVLKAPWNKFYCDEIFPLVTGQVGYSYDTVVCYTKPNNGRITFGQIYNLPAHRCGFSAHVTLK
ncbi:MAG: hypothetical protein J6U97_01390, partial [Bacteroidaceae bacterium]|nr:hypothetical protein [Bacteroidaceae bacterium]